MYQYLLSTLFVLLLWVGIFLKRRDVRPAMWRGSVLYVALLSVGFVVYRIFFHDPVRAITPGYWAPPTLLNLQRITHGFGIEDALFMFTFGGIAAVIVECVLRKKLPPVNGKKLNFMGLAAVLAVGALGSLVVYFAAYLSDMYLLISSSFFAGLAIMVLRKDLIPHALAGGTLFLLLYGTLFVLFAHVVAPHFIALYYHQRATSGVHFLSIPIEEFMYAFAFGMFWAPLYRFAYGLKAAE